MLRSIFFIVLGVSVSGMAFTAVFSAEKNESIVIQSKEVVFRFAIGSDSHYGSNIIKNTLDGNTRNVANIVTWMNRAKNDSLLDCVLINGYITMNHRTFWTACNYPMDQGDYVESHYINIKENHLDNMEMPVVLNKGNHDYVDPDTSEDFHTWEGIWGPLYQDYDSYTVTWGGPQYKTGNHVIEDTDNNYAWIMANASVYGESEKALRHVSGHRPHR